MAYTEYTLRKSFPDISVCRAVVPHTSHVVRQSTTSGIVVNSRSSVIAWLIEKCTSLNLLIDTYAIAVSLFDRSRNQVPHESADDQWLAAVALSISCKYMEAKSPAVEHIFAFLVDKDQAPFLGTLDRIRVNIIEVLILRSVDYKVRCVSTCCHENFSGQLHKLYRFVFYFAHFDPQLARSPRLGSSCAYIVRSVSGNDSDFDLLAIRIVHVINALYRNCPDLAKKCQAVLL